MPLNAAWLVEAFDLGSVRRIAFAGYCAAVAGLVAYVATVEWSAATGWVVLRCLALAMLAVAPFFPWVGAGVYVFLAYGTPRYETDLVVLVSSHILDLVALLAVCALLVRRRGLSDILRGLRAPLPMLMLALGLWVVVAATVAWVNGVPWRPNPRHTPVLFAHGLAMFLVARYALGTRSASCSFAFAVCLSLGLRALTQGAGGLYLEGDVAPLIVMVVPLSIMGVRLAPGLLPKALFGAVGVYLTSALLVTHNRAAALAGAAVLVAGLWQMRRYRWLFRLGIPAFLVAAVLLAPQGYKDRFRALWDPGASHRTAALDRATAAARLELWQAGWEMGLASPWVGVGPGNYPHVVDRYAPGKARLAAHSSYLHMLAETGFPGLVLYVVLFASALLALSLLRHACPDEDQRFAAGMLQLSLVAYLVAGVFISRHDFPLAYLLAGWAAAISARSWTAALDRPRVERAEPRPVLPPAVER